MLPKIDLHVHSSPNSSDACTPLNDIPSVMKDHRVGVVAISDHNRITNVEHLRKEHPDMVFIQSCEFSACYKDKHGFLHEVHVGGHNLPLDDSRINEIFRKQDAFDDEGYLREILYKVKCHCNIDISLSEVLEHCPAGKRPGRSCVAKAMMAHGFGTFNEIYDKYLGDRTGQKPCYVSNASRYASFEEVVSVILCSGGIPILNHILLSRLGDEENRRLCRIFKDITGEIGGIESSYSGFTSYEQVIVNSYAETYHLLRSCGGDYHGRDNRNRMGFPRSSCDEQLLELLQIPPL